MKHFVCRIRQWKFTQQDCIPVGCILPACWPYLPACTMHWGICSGGGVWSGGVPGPGGAWSGGSVVSQHALWTEWQTGAKILPCPKLRLRAVITKKKDLVNFDPLKYNVEKIEVTQFLPLKTLREVFPSRWYSFLWPFTSNFSLSITWFRAFHIWN